MTPPAPKTLLEAIQHGLADAGKTADGVAPPAAILWTDPDGQWRPVIEPLRKLVPHLYALGLYDPEHGTGPAIWLKCVVDRALPDLDLPADAIPVLYLPGVARAVLRSAEDCPPAHQPLVELCYRGQTWHHRNGRDWTVEGFVEAVLEIDLAGDQATRNALTRMLPRVATEPVVSLLGRRIDAEILLKLDVDDPVGDLLSWMSEPEAFRQRCDDGKWQSIRQLWLKTYGFDPEADGVTAAGDKLVNDQSPTWAGVWRRFCVAPKLYPGLSKVLRMSYKDLFAGSDRNPRFNEDGEVRLRAGLEAAVDLPHQDACDKVIALEAEHADRRNTPWAELGESPLADALQPLAKLAQMARSGLGGANATAMADAYAADGWRCDRAALEALTKAMAHKPHAWPLCRVIRALYLPWLDQSARHLQDLLGASDTAASALVHPFTPEAGTCFLFVDGLRYDVAMTLREQLESMQLPCTVGHRFAPLPTVTATAKPVAMPVGPIIGPGGAPEDFCPHLSGTTTAAGVQKLRQALEQKGAVIVAPTNPQGPAGAGDVGWCETGKLDELGHKLDIGLIRQIEDELSDLVMLIDSLLSVGWPRVRVVTDHGWLLMPEGLPKVDLPKSVTSAKWARCAAVKDGASPGAATFPWYWDPHVRIAMPPGVGSYLANAAYAHGGISLQECVIPELTVSRGAVPISAIIKQVGWRGLRVRIKVETSTAGLTVDLRQKRNNPGTSIAASVKELKDTGEASLAVEDDSNMGTAAFVVVLDTDGNVIAAQMTTVGDE
ncbi:MAG TPA: BREX-1 system phosphatase PglZ type B [Azospirillum sp.]|nr:BREX-1 system phosphatase PglZ type B [Azospirillum sp.]